MGSIFPFKEFYKKIYEATTINKSMWTVELNLHCNEKCIFCSRDAHELKESETISTLELESFIPKYQIITFCGGEALLDPRLPDLLQFCKAQHKITTLITNGSILSNKNLCDKIFPNLDFITVSIPSLNQKTFEYLTGSDLYFSLLKGLENLSQWSGQLYKSVNIILLKSSLETLKETLEKLDSFHLSDFYLYSFLYPIFLGRLQDYPEEYLSYAEIQPFLDPILSWLKSQNKLIRLENCSQCITSVTADFIDAEESYGKHWYYTKKINNQLINYTRDDILNTFSSIKACKTCPKKGICHGITNTSRILFDG